MDSLGISLAVTRGQLVVIYSCPFPYTPDANCWQTLIDWARSLNRSTRNPACDCGLPMNEHMKDCVLRKTQQQYRPGPAVTFATGMIDWRSHEWQWSRMCYLKGPLWLPFVVLAVWPTVAFVRGPVRRFRRRRKGLCLHCGYNLTGLPEARCPECGAGVGAEDQ